MTDSSSSQKERGLDYFQILTGKPTEFSENTRELWELLSGLIISEEKIPAYTF